MLTNKIDRQLLLDILTDGFESWSSRFWAQAEIYRWTDWYEADQTTIKDSLTDDTVLIRLRDRDDEGGAEQEWKEWHDITLRKLEEATQWALVHYNHTFQGYSVDKDGVIAEIQYDAISADIVLQRIVLGDAVYG